MFWSRWPPGVFGFLVYAFGLLAVQGLLLRWVVDQAVNSSVSPIGVLWMVLLAYTIFTITMTLQRKQVARNLALGLSTLPVPLAIALLFAPQPGVAIVPAALAALLFVGLTRRSARDFFSEP
jgi:hypothetical protein